MCLVNIIRMCAYSLCVFVCECVCVSVCMWVLCLCVWVLSSWATWYLAIWILCKYEFSSFTTFFQNLWFYLLVIRGVPSLIIAQTQVLAPLNSWPVNGYRKDGATPICIWSPVQSGSWDMLYVGLEHVGSLHTILHMLWVTGLMVVKWL